MIRLSDQGVYLQRGILLAEDELINEAEADKRLAGLGLPAVSSGRYRREAARKGTITAQILAAHNRSGNLNDLELKADALASHDITYVGIIQTARGSGLKEFPVPYILTNCHNSLAAVGGTVNEDDHLFGLSAARKYGGILVPAHLAVIHQYLREMIAGSGKLILASDSHTRFGALGAMGFGEGGPEIVKQLLGRTYDLPYPRVVGVYLTGRPAPGVGPQDVALAIIRAVYPSGYTENKVMEFIGPGVSTLSVDFRSGIDVMTTEANALSSIWQTDERVRVFYETHGRPEDYRELKPEEICYYDGLVSVELDKIEPMIALPFHPSNAWPISELNLYAGEILREVERTGEKLLGQKSGFKLTDKLIRGRLKVDQGVVVGCAGGTFENILTVAEILKGRSPGDGEFVLSLYPASQPIYLELLRRGAAEKLIQAGTIVRTAFCGPCFGAGDVPANQTLSIRHATRNFPNREGSIPAQGQLASVALMDARSIAATALNGGLLTSAFEIDVPPVPETYRFDQEVYKNRVYRGAGKGRPEEPLRFGPNIADWPRFLPLSLNLVLKVASVILDPVTTTDELIPSGETSVFRSNPLKLAEYTLSRKDPAYVSRAKAINEIERRRLEAAAGGETPGRFADFDLIPGKGGGSKTDREKLIRETSFASVIVAVNPGDGSAREQAVSCQKVLGGQANIAVKYATKRYRSNLINWGMLPFVAAAEDLASLQVDDLLYLPGLRAAIENGMAEVEAFLIRGEEERSLRLKLGELSSQEREIILAGCLMNYYASGSPG